MKKYKWPLVGLAIGVIAAELLHAYMPDFVRVLFDIAFGGLLFFVFKKNAPAVIEKVQS